ncbi:Hypothetical predicted protein, partial [Paramuricea clavata]
MAKQGIRCVIVIQGNSTNQGYISRYKAMNSAAKLNPAFLYILSILRETANLIFSEKSCCETAIRLVEIVDIQCIQANGTAVALSKDELIIFKQ